jgi:FKBP-type peptidyl-prolyl cis-trans isomerase
MSAATPNGAISEADLGGAFSEARSTLNCFKRAPVLPLPDAIRSLLSLREAPRDRPDLQDFIPDDDDADAAVREVSRLIPVVKLRTSVQPLISQVGLSDDDLGALILYKMEHPYPVYRWLNGWLLSSRRDPEVVQKVGPLFTLIYRAMEKLPKVTRNAARGVVVRNIPSLVNTYNNFLTRLAPGMPLNFWGFSSFSVDPAVYNSPTFLGGQGDPAIMYVCGALTGVSMEPFKPDGMDDEAEILPLCPAIFKVTACAKVGTKVTVAISAEPNDGFTYVVPKHQGSVQPQAVQVQQVPGQQTLATGAQSHSNQVPPQVKSQEPSRKSEQVLIQPGPTVGGIGQEFELPGSDGKLFKTILREGDGGLPPQGCQMSVHYVGTFPDGREFDSSRKTNRPFNFQLGRGQVIKGWDVGAGSMKKGELAILRIHPDWAYGKKGFAGIIPPSQKLMFEIEVIDFK